MIYLDHHAATPLCAAAVQAMAAADRVAWANPASVHGAGRAARAVLERARDQVAAAVGGQPAEVIFTSGGTEACALGILGLSGAAGPGLRIVTSAIEHPAVSAQLAHLAEQGATVLRLPVYDGCPPTPEALAAALAQDGSQGVSLVAIQWVNHETGTHFPIEAYAQVCGAAGVPLFVDGTQALGKVPVQVQACEGLTALALASHKIGGPSGAGALWLRRGQQVASQLRGGGQERGRRAGTPDVRNLVGFGAACAAVSERLACQEALRGIRDGIEGRLVQWRGPAGGLQFNGQGGPRVGTVLNVSVPRCTGAALVMALDVAGLCCASGAACSSGVSEPSPVLLAMYPEDRGRASAAVRLSFGPECIDLEWKFVSDQLLEVFSRVARLRA